MKKLLLKWLSFPFSDGTHGGVRMKIRLPDIFRSPRKTISSQIIMQESTIAYWFIIKYDLKDYKLIISYDWSIVWTKLFMNKALTAV